MSRAFSYCLRASSWSSRAISGSAFSTSGMGGMCTTTLLAVEATTPAQAGHGGAPAGVPVPYRDMAQRIILDCDPGIDDALAIAFAHGHPGIELVGITTVAGNVGLAKTTANALAVSEFVGAAGTPVTAGCAGPLLRPALDARHVHGDSGLGGAVLAPAAASPAPGHAIDYIVGTVSAAPGEITLVATGPLTNIALAVKREPRLADWVRRFVIMGGSA